MTYRITINKPRGTFAKIDRRLLHLVPTTFPEALAKDVVLRLLNFSWPESVSPIWLLHETCSGVGSRERQVRKVLRDWGILTYKREGFTHHYTWDIEGFLSRLNEIEHAPVKTPVNNLPKESR